MNRLTKYKLRMKKILFVVIVLACQIMISQENEDFSFNKTDVFSEKFSKYLFVESFQDKKGNTGALRYFDEKIYVDSKNKVKGVATKKVGGFLRGITIQKWNDKGETILNKTFMLNLEDKNSIGRVFYNDGRYYVFEFLRNKKNKSLDYFVNIFNDENLIERKEVFSVNVNKFPKKNPSGKYGYDFDYYGYFSFSEDKSNILYSIDGGISSTEDHKILVFNKNLELLYNKEFKNDSEDLLCQVQDISINNEGNVYFLAKYFKGSLSVKKKGKVNYSYKLFKINKEKEESIVLNTSNHFIPKLKLTQKGSKLVCAGFSSKKNENTKEGIAFYSVDNESMEIINSTFKSFAFSNSFQFYKDIKLNSDLSLYRFKDLVISDKGNCVFTAEEIEFTYYQDYVAHTVKDIMVVYFSIDGEIKWGRNINKENEVSSSPIFNNNEDVYLFINTDKELKNKSKRNNLYGVKLGKDRGVKKTIRLKDNSDLIFDVVGANRVDDSKIIFSGSKDKKTQLITISL